MTSIIGPPINSDGPEETCLSPLFWEQVPNFDVEPFHPTQEHKDRVTSIVGVHEIFNLTDEDIRAISIKYQRNPKVPSEKIAFYDCSQLEEIQYHKRTKKLIQEKQELFRKFQIRMRILDKFLRDIHGFPYLSQLFKQLVFPASKNVLELVLGDFVLPVQEGQQESIDKMAVKILYLYSLFQNVPKIFRKSSLAFSFVKREIKSSREARKFICEEIQRSKLLVRALIQVKFQLIQYLTKNDLEAFILAFGLQNGQEIVEEFTGLLGYCKSFKLKKKKSG